MIDGETGGAPDQVSEQYEAFPYPERDPADEAHRLITGSPSHPVEIDHFVFRGRRDWLRPFRALVAGGGTGDAAIMLAQSLSDLGCPAEIIYLDLSTASRAVAEARAAARGLTSIRFLTGDLLEAPGLGPFDYIDCCGVLHHLPEPQAGFDALARAVAPEGGIGIMVYAPLGRTGVYPLQSAFGALFEGLAPEARIPLARAALDVLPETNWLHKNPFVGDHKAGDAGLYDLLLHGRDRPYRVSELRAAVEGAGLRVAGLIAPGRYEPMRYLPPALAERVAGLAPAAAEQVAEDLAGNIKAHVVYAVPGARGESVARPSGPDAVAHLNGLPAGPLAAHVAKAGRITFAPAGIDFVVPVPRAAAAALARVDGRTSLGEIAAALGQDWLTFAGAWAPVDRALGAFNLLHYSRGARYG